MMWQNAGKCGLDQWNFTLQPTSQGQVWIILIHSSVRHHIALHLLAVQPVCTARLAPSSLLRASCWLGSRCC